MTSKILAEREAEFWSQHANYDSKWARNILHNMSEFTPFVFEFEAASTGLSAMYEASGIVWPEEASWADADESLPLAEMRKLKVYQLALAIRAYAHFGLKLPAQNDAYDQLAFLETYELDFVPPQWGQDPEMDRAIRAAQGRRKLDTDARDGLTMEELAALAVVERKSVLNMLAPARREREGLELDLDGRVTVRSARRWLLQRPAFKESVWQLGDVVGTPLAQGKPNPVLQDPVFVPTASDGSWFSPMSRTISKDNRTPRYHVANGENEEVFDDYWSALGFLARATAPRWRYFDEVNRWRVKDATGWTRRTKAEIEQEIP